MNKFFLAVLIIFVLVAIPTVLFLYKNSTAIKAESVLCKDFQKTKNEVACEDAVMIALASTPGAAQKVSIGPMFNVGDSASLSEELRENLWLIDIKVAHPYFDTIFQKKIEFLRIGIGLNEHTGIHKKPLDL